MTQLTEKGGAPKETFEVQYSMNSPRIYRGVDIPRQLREEVKLLQLPVRNERESPRDVLRLLRAP